MKTRLKANNPLVIKAALERSRILKSLGKDVDPKTARIAKRKPAKSALGKPSEELGSDPVHEAGASGRHSVAESEPLFGVQHVTRPDYLRNVPEEVEPSTNQGSTLIVHPNDEVVIRVDGVDLHIRGADARHDMSAIPTQQEVRGADSR